MYESTTTSDQSPKSTQRTRKPWHRPKHINLTTPHIITKIGNNAVEMNNQQYTVNQVIHLNESTTINNLHFQASANVNPTQNITIDVGPS